MQTPAADALPWRSGRGGRRRGEFPEISVWTEVRFSDDRADRLLTHMIARFQLPFSNRRIHWQFDQESGSPAQFTGDFDIAPMLLNDLVRNGQSQAGTLALSAGVLRRIKGIKDVLKYIGADSG